MNKMNKNENVSEYEIGISFFCYTRSYKTIATTCESIIWPHTKFLTAIL